MTATVRQPTILAGAERLLLATRLTLAMLAAGLLALALLWRWVSPQDNALPTLIAGTAAMLVAVPVLTAAWHSLRHPSLHGITDRLIALALIGAWAAGDLMTAAILPIVMIGAHVLEERSLLGSREAIAALSRLTQTSARRQRRDGTIEIVPTAALHPGDLIDLRAGDRVPADGIVRQGTASLDTASLTGESVPIDVTTASQVMAGAIDTDGHLLVEVQRLGAQTTLGRIIGLMREAEDAKPPVTRLLERYAGHYIVLVLMVSAGTWFASGDTAAALAVLVAACPCALVLAAPAAAIAAIATASRHGILIKGTAFLESLADVTSVVFDKTGTLTTGALTLTELRPAPGIGPETLRALAAALGAASSHPVSRAAQSTAETHLPIEGAREAGGFGVTATLHGQQAAFGRPDLFGRLGVPTPPPPAHEGPIAGVSLGGRFQGWLLFADQPRREAAEALADLRALGLARQMLLTGDRVEVAAAIAAAVGIETIHAGALPDDKMRRVQAEIRAGFRPLVVGDGINDALALRAGAVGIAMGAQGTDIAFASADVVLMSSDLRRVSTAIRLSRACRGTIAVNVGVGLGWTLLLMALAAAGVLGAEGAVLAAILHNVSTFFGVANAGRLLLFDDSQGSVLQTSHLPDAVGT